MAGGVVSRGAGARGEGLVVGSVFADCRQGVDGASLGARLGGFVTGIERRPALPRVHSRGACRPRRLSGAATRLGHCSGGACGTGRAPLGASLLPGASARGRNIRFIGFGVAGCVEGHHTERQKNQGKARPNRSQSQHSNLHQEQGHVPHAEHRAQGANDSASRMQAMVHSIFGQLSSDRSRRRPFLDSPTWTHGPQIVRSTRSTPAGWRDVSK